MFSEDFESFVTNLIFLLQLRVVSDSGKLLLRRRRRQHWGCDYKDLGCSVPVEVHERACTHERTETHTHTHALFSHMYRHLHTRTTDTLAGEHAHTYTVSLFPLTSALTQHRVYETHAHTICHSLSLSLSLSLCLFLSWKHLIFSSHLFPKVARSLPPILWLKHSRKLALTITHFQPSTLFQHITFSDTHTHSLSLSRITSLSLWLFFKTLK